MHENKFLDALQATLEALGRKLETLDLVIVSKGRDVDQMMRVLKICQRLNFRSITFGENYVSELARKLHIFGPEMFHFIGRCKTGIVEQLIKKRVFIQTISSLKQLNVVQESNSKCFIQVNIANDERKSGFSLETALEVYESNKGCVRGVMTILNQNFSDEKKFECFLTLRKAFPDAVLSAGMSSDWHLALRAGSDLIRIGNALFNNA
ncbi:MAG: alanine racemase [Deltaproteobacteria bacterium]|nr:alanine racemase [Deltaproteobacteria bacterium]